MLCDGCKFKDDCVDYGWSGCKKFTPKPKPIEEQTNEEWLRQCTTEEFAEFIYNTAITDMLMDRLINAENGIEEAMEWLKEKHND